MSASIAVIFRLMTSLSLVSGYTRETRAPTFRDSRNAPVMPPTAVRGLRPEAHVVGQLIHVVGPAWEETGQRRTHLGHGADDGAADGARAKPIDHAIAHRRPVVVAHPRVDPLVADDSELAVLEGEIDEDARSMPGAVHPQRREHLARTLHRVRRAPAQAVSDPPLDVHADLRRGPPLGLAHGGHDGVEVGVAENAARPAWMAGHHQSPLAPPPPKPPPPPEKSPPPPDEPPPPPPPPQKIGGCTFHPP